MRRELPAWITARYTPLPVPAINGPVLSGVLATLALLRGFDYLQTPTPNGEVLAFVEYLGVRSWGWAFLVCGTLLWLALVSQRLAALVVAHVLLLGLYLGYTVSITQGVYLSGAGFRFVGQALAGFIIGGLRIYSLSDNIRHTAAEVEELAKISRSAR